jgi:hypothetical protein
VADPRVLGSIARVAAPGATLELYLNTTAFLERVPGELRTLPVPTPEYCDVMLSPAYAAAGITLVERRLVGRQVLARLESTWARRLAQARAPQALYVRGVVGQSAPAAAPH